MKMNLVALRIFVFLACYLLGPFGLALAATSVSGCVRDAAGNTPAHAYVKAIPQKTEASAGTVGDLPNRWIAVNEKGEFELSLPPGRYKIRAKDEADGYPDPMFWISADPTAKVSEVLVGEQAITGLEVRLGALGGIIDGNLQDSLTHKPLVGGKVRIQDARNSDAFVEVFTDSSGRFQFTVPCKPLVISTTASGHKPTAFQSGEQVILSSGEHRHLEFELERQ